MRPNNWKDIEPTEWLTLEEAANLLNVAKSQITNWAREDKDNGFPEPLEIGGTYKMYNEQELLIWHELWRRITINMTNGEKLNGTRTDS